ncbi:Uncharacterized lipoprotein YddW, UPF0748 family [Geosporobacter subterraneus DSM 17957]|uniref:Uncharacterized lipoprotein YddW, UPF0748 family n=1 Tax=Geosporobacter subterraneus DSM 17957 TaxID=1121919 RepID=A0A1M6EF95_9FIRM|nr:N-acetylmuramoyl-L-alanine amidase [Geosporobacter subterraneus]SHI84152.1 Uncharacterized lipoprotein YddW, UPF0748 family [Geosporobacter subterraneus DSM 17957]
MKKITRISITIVLLAFILQIWMPHASSDPIHRGELRGLWVATVLNIDYPSKPTEEPEVLKAEALKILDHAADMGLNAVFLQVRPASDAIYKSRYFPWSKYLTGKQGQAPKDGFDPLAFWIAEAHNRGIELHAWINPYRGTKKTAVELNHDLASLDATNPIRLKPDWIVKHTDGNFYYDPGLPEVRQLVIDGVLEIIENYDIDGIHFDDYFYPGKDFNDKAAYEKYGKGYSNINDWRRENVNLLIRDLSEAIKQTQKNIRFGISPFGIWANSNTNPLGSDTKGMQSYYDQFADTRKWVKEGWIDYIAPQIYWNIGFAVADYSKLLSWWKDTVNGTEVDLYIGQAAYRAGNPDPSSPWYGISEIEKQLQLNTHSPEVKGSIFFSYKSFENNPALAGAVKAFYEKKDGFTVRVPVSVSRPADNIKTGLSQYYLNGASDPEQPLFLNGKPVENRSPQGYFGILVPLEKGANQFTFSQEGSYVTRVIFRETPSAAAKKLSAAEIPAASVFPKEQEYRTPGEKITLSCQAPIGSKVTVNLGGKSYTMKPSGLSASGQGIFADTYTHVYTIPTYAGTPRIIDLGTPVYTMNYKGATKTSKAPAKIGVVMKNAPFYAEVVKSVADTYSTPTTGNGAAYELYSGMTDYVTGMTGNFVRLSSGQWINKKDVKTYATQSPLTTKIQKAEYSTGEKWDTLNIDLSKLTTVFSSFDGNVVKLDISAAAGGVIPTLPEEAMVSSVAVLQNTNSLQYTLTLKKDHFIEGYFIEKTPTGIALMLKRPVVSVGGDQPLAGITIMIDPGHGGSDTGALGPLGAANAEKSINLNTALKLQQELEQLGAIVLMTRNTDIDVSLEERLAASRNARPDLFISIHANSMGDNVDIAKIDGFSVFYREKLAQLASEKVFMHTLDTLKRNSKGLHNKNFYVTRGTWAPSILIESGFVPNPYEYEWLINDEDQALLAKTLAEAILQYFSTPKSPIK